ncbi:MMP21 protein, partial [Amia calva]|nr:MMP21 protein [Amia calva]
MKPVAWEESQLDNAPGSGDSDPTSRVEEGISGSRLGQMSTSRSSGDNAHFSLAIEEFQRVSGLPLTGLLDDATKAAMNKPRCGVLDKEADISSPVSTNATDTVPSLNRTLSNGTTEGNGTPTPRRKRFLATLLSRLRRKREAVGAGQVAFSSKVLKWRLIGEGYSSQLSIADQRSIFSMAFRMWSEVCPLEFEEDHGSPLSEIDIRLGFGTGRHLGCTQSFDGAGREFAHAWFQGDIHFDDDEHFTAPNSGNGISLLKVAVHEIGHVLGLPHIYRPGSIMQPSYIPQDSGFEIDWTDRKAIQQLYGGCSGRFHAVFDWVRKERTAYGELVIRFNTYFVRDGWYWLLLLQGYENRPGEARLSDQLCVCVCVFVCLCVSSACCFYVLGGAQYWRYDSENDQAYAEDPQGHRYPRLISEGFPGIPSPVDTAYYDRRDARIYFFKGSEVYGFDVRAHRVARGFPRRLSEVFRSVEPGDHPQGSLDAAYFSYSHNALFLLKGTRFWRVVGSQDRRVNASLPHNGLLPGRAVNAQWFDICNVHKTALRASR